MGKNIKQRKSLWKKLKELISVINRTDLKNSVGYRQKWEKYEELLMYRSNLSIAFRLVSDLVVLFTGVSHFTVSEEYV